MTPMQPTATMIQAQDRPAFTSAVQIIAGFSRFFLLKMPRMTAATIAQNPASAGERPITSTKTIVQWEL